MTTNDIEQVRVASPAACTDADRLEISEAITALDPSLVPRFPVQLRESAGDSLFSPLLVHIVGPVSAVMVAAVIEAIRAWRRRRIMKGHPLEPITVDLLGPQGEVLKRIVLDAPPDQAPRTRVNDAE